MGPARVGWQGWQVWQGRWWGCGVCSSASRARRRCAPLRLLTALAARDAAPRHLPGPPASPGLAPSLAWPHACLPACLTPAPLLARFHGRPCWWAPAGGQPAKGHVQDRVHLPDHHRRVDHHRAGSTVWALRPRVQGRRGCVLRGAGGSAAACCAAPRRALRERQPAAAPASPATAASRAGVLCSPPVHAPTNPALAQAAAPRWSTCWSSLWEASPCEGVGGLCFCASVWSTPVAQLHMSGRPPCASAHQRRSSGAAAVRAARPSPPDLPRRPPAALPPAAPCPPC